MQKLGHIAYNKLEGKKPAVVFLSGFKSDMKGTKALFLEKLCREKGQQFIRFDYSGHGKSGGEFKDGTITQWKDDALKVIDELTKGEVILVGSSMGGWIMLLCALARPERVKALIGIAAAPDFTNKMVSKKQRSEIDKNGFTLIDNCYDGGEPYPITKKLLDDGANNILLDKTININVPARLLQGMKDADVPYQTAEKIANALVSDDVEIHYVKNGDHRLSSPQNLELLKSTFLSIIGK